MHTYIITTANTMTIYLPLLSKSRRDNSPKIQVCFNAFTDTKQFAAPQVMHQILIIIIIYMKEGD